MAAFYDSPGFDRDEEYKTIDGVTIFPASRKSCPVCGHETGDCSPDKEEGPSVIFGYNTNSSFDNDQVFVVKEDIFDEREIAPGVVMRLLIYKKDKAIPLLKAKELGLI